MTSTIMRQIGCIGLICGIAALLGCSVDPMGGFDRALVAGYHLRCTSGGQNEITNVDDNRLPGVPDQVVEIAWNERFILAKQQRLKPRGDFPGDEVPVPVPGKFNYWIIDTARTNRYGPLSESEFNERATFLGQSSLKLKSILKARKS
jgi:hypothetical protein